MYFCSYLIGTGSPHTEQSNHQLSCRYAFCVKHSNQTNETGGRRCKARRSADMERDGALDAPEA